MSNIAGKAYAMNVLTPMPPRWTWVNRLIFQVSRTLPSFLGALIGLKLIHFARWVIIKRHQWPVGDGKPQQLQYDYMLFCSNFNGTWDQYIDAFSDGVAKGLDFYWYASVKYPHSIPITTFKNYIVHNQFDTTYYYNATPGAGQRDIKAALRVRRELMSLEQVHAGGDKAAFAKAYRKSLRVLQNSLPSQGYAPIASTDTWNADVARSPFAHRQRPAREAPPPLPQATTPAVPATGTAADTADAAPAPDAHAEAPPAIQAEPPAAAATAPTAAVQPEPSPATAWEPAEPVPAAAPSAAPQARQDSVRPKPAEPQG